jgi:uncharacterized protein (TIGR00299 family) protein
MSILKIEAFSGLSGDMFLSSLAELCDAHDDIKALPSRLNIDEEAEVVVKKISKKGIVCKHVKILDKKKDTDSLRHHRHLSDINQIIEQGDISDKAKKIAKKIFLLLGEAESDVHGVSIEKIHFHEVGANSILDIVGAAVLIENLNVAKTYCTTIITGSGFTNTEHGRLPVPTPATKNLLKGFPTQTGNIESELVTPTGAAILKYLNPDFSIPPLIDEKIAYGAGEKDFEIPNTLRISLCKTSYPYDTITIMQTNIDDMSGEYLGVEFQEKLLSLGALDFHFEQVLMKRGRPGVVLNVLVRKENSIQIADYIFQNTSSIGVRFYEAGRFELKRKSRDVETQFGKIKMKDVQVPGYPMRSKPESKDIITIAEKENKSSIYVLQQILKNNENESNE